MTEQAIAPVVVSPVFVQDALFLRLAREIAMDIMPIDAILKSSNVTDAQWERIREHPRFIQLLISNQEQWASSLNTAERVRVKSLAMVEEILPEFYERMFDRKESLTSKTEVLRTVAKFAGLGDKAAGANEGERFTVTINMGADQQVKIEKNVTPQVTAQAALIEAAINPDGTVDML